MSGSEINRSIWIIILPMLFLFAILMLIFVSPLFTPDAWNGFNGTEIVNGMSVAMPFMGIGAGIAALFLVYAVIARRRR